MHLSPKVPVFHPDPTTYRCRQRWCWGLVFCVLSLWWGQPAAFGQALPADTCASPAAMAHTISLFREAAGMQVGLYNGPAHRGYPTGFKNGIPYFLSSSPGLGTVVYNGVAYPQVRLLYDLVQDEVIVEREADGVQINLLREKTTAFTLHGHTFVFFSPDSAAVAGVAAGFYDQLYRGQVSVLARRVNRLQERTVQSGVERTVRQRVRYYLRKDGHYHPIKSRGALLGHLKEHRKAVQANLRESGIRYGEDPEAAMVRMAAYYDQLTRRP